MPKKKNNDASDSLGIKSLPRIDVSPEVKDLAMTVAETITAKLQRSLLKQSEIIDVLIQDQPWKMRLVAVNELMVTMKEIVSSIPEIHGAVMYATKAGWKIGSVQAVSSQNTLNINIRHLPSRLLKKELAALWATGKWRFKKTCVEDNYERLMREFGLWNDNKDTQKPAFESVLRSL